MRFAKKNYIWHGASWISFFGQKRITFFWDFCAPYYFYTYSHINSVLSTPHMACIVSDAAVLVALTHALVTNRKYVSHTRKSAMWERKRTGGLQVICFAHSGDMWGEINNEKTPRWCDSFSAFQNFLHHLFCDRRSYTRSTIFTSGVRLRKIFWWGKSNRGDLLEKKNALVTKRG